MTDSGWIDEGKCERFLGDSDFFNSLSTIATPNFDSVCVRMLLESGDQRFCRRFIHLDENELREIRFNDLQGRTPVFFVSVANKASSRPGEQLEINSILPV